MTGFVEDIIESKRPLFLNLPGDLSEAVFQFRYLEMFAGKEISIYVHANHSQMQLFDMSAIHPVNLDNLPDHKDVLFYDLKKLRYFAGGTTVESYLTAPDSCRQKVIESVKCKDSIRIGLCLDSFKELPDLIFKAFTVHQLMNMEFYLFSTDAAAVAAKMPVMTNFIEISSNYGLDVVSSWLEQMHIVVAEENLFAHLAGALGKKVWLLAPNGIESLNIEKFVKSYLDVSVVYWEESPMEALQKISIYQYFRISETFRPFTTALDRTINIDIPQLPFRQIEDVNDVPELIMELYNCLTNVAIETTTICNLRCPYCPNSTIGRKPAYMETATYKKIIDSLADYVPDYSGTLSPHFYGEPLLDMRLEGLVSYTREKLPKASIEIYTNGEYLTLDRFITLKTAGVDLFRISQHTEEPSEVVQETLTEVRRSYPDLFTVEYKEFWSSPGKSNRGGLVEVEGIDKNMMKRVTGCSIAHRLLTFDYMGNAVLCCNDYLSESSFGNILSKSVKDIWEDYVYRRVRNQLMFGYLPLDICKRCFAFTSK